MEPTSASSLGAGPAPHHLLGGARLADPPPERASDGGDVRASGAWVPYRGPPPPFPASVGLATLWSSGVRVALPRPQLSSPVSAWWVPQSRGHCPFNSCPGRSWAVLATARARPPIRARAPAGPPPLAPAPARAARAGAGRWRRYCCRPRGASPPPAARGPGEGRGQPRTGPGSPPLPSHASRKVCPFALCPAAPGAPRRRGESWGSGGVREGTPAEECAGQGGGEPGSRFAPLGGGRLAAGAGIMCCLSRGGAERCQARAGRRLAGLEDRIRMAAQKGRAGGLCENCGAGKVQVARGPLWGQSASLQPRLLPVPPGPYTVHRPTPVPLSESFTPQAPSSATPFPVPEAVRASPQCVPSVP